MNYGHSDHFRAGGSGARCRVCRGWGRRVITRRRCPDCNGDLWVEADCDRCEGSGEGANGGNCRRCRGEGVVEVVCETCELEDPGWVVETRGCEHCGRMTRLG